MEVSGKTVRALMRANHLTIAGIARQWGLTQKRVRQVRECGAVGVYGRDWMQILTSPPALASKESA